MLEPGRVTGRVRGGIYVRECKTNGRETILTRENIFVIMYVVTLFFFFFLLFFFFFFLPPLVTFSNQISFNAMARERERKRGRGGGEQARVDELEQQDKDSNSRFRAFGSNRLVVAHAVGTR